MLNSSVTSKVTLCKITASHIEKYQEQNFNLAYITICTSAVTVDFPNLY